MADSSTRERMLGRIRRAIGADPEDAARRKTVAARLAGHARNLVPARADLPAAQRIELFASMAGEVQTTIDRVAEAQAIPAAVADYLRRHNLPQTVRHGADRLIAGLDWRAGAPQIELSTGPAEASDAVSVSHAFAGVAETGTLVMTSGADNPVTLNFLPENHIVVLEAKDIVGAYEDVWDRLRKVRGEGVMPRTVNMITGPSRSADIAQRLELGAHGPRRLHVIIVGA